MSEKKLIGKEAKEKNAAEKEFALETIVTKAIQVPGVKVNRASFLEHAFDKEKDIDIERLIEVGPIEYGCTKEQLSKIAGKKILERTSESTAISFGAGIPGGYAALATVPVDLVQFFGMSLRLAQEISYLYGATDLWTEGQVDDEAVRNQLLLYIGSMFGVQVATSGIKVLAGKMAPHIAKKLGQSALTKTFWYPIVKKIGTMIGVTITKKTVSSAAGKIIPIVGGVVSGTLTFASMYPMANRLKKTMEVANFDYTEEAFEADFKVVTDACAASDEEMAEKTSKDLKSTLGEKLDEAGKKVSDNLKYTGNAISGLFAKKPKEGKNAVPAATESISVDEIIETIEKLAKLKESGILSEEDFEAKKQDLLARI